MVERNEPPWAFRPPDSRTNREKAIEIADAKGIRFNKLIASYVVEGIERDWARLQDAESDKEDFRKAVRKSLDDGSFQPIAFQPLARPFVDPNFKKGKS